MADFKYRATLSSTGAYLVAGVPWLTGSAIAVKTEHKISFPSITRSITVINRATPDLFVHFNTSSAGEVTSAVGRHYLTLSAAKDSMTFNVKCKEIYITNDDASSAGEYEIFAELTPINDDRMFALTGSGLTDREGTAHSWNG